MPCFRYTMHAALACQVGISVIQTIEGGGDKRGNPYGMKESVCDMLADGHGLDSGAPSGAFKVASLPLLISVQYVTRLRSSRVSRIFSVESYRLP